MDHTLKNESMYCYITLTNIACVVGPKCKLVTQPIFPSNIIVCNLFELLVTKLLKTQYLPHLRFKIFQIAFIESYSSKIIKKYEKGDKGIVLWEIST
jgi:hypothetical protein